MAFGARVSERDRFPGPRKTAAQGEAGSRAARLGRRERLVRPAWDVVNGSFSAPDVMNDSHDVRRRRSADFTEPRGAPTP
jgi:hypothetical protein